MRKWMIAIFALASTTVAARAQEAAAGQETFNRICTICHAVGEGAVNKLGPALNGLDGRRSGSVEAFTYSDAMKNAGIVWSETTFKEFMPNPTAKVAGTRMIVAVRDEKDIANLWAYFKQFGPDGKVK
jgi:cytochrome c